MADLAPAKCAHQDVQLSVPIEIGGAHVGDSWKPAVRMRLVLTALEAPQPYGGPFFFISRQELAEIGNQQIAQAISVEIDGLRVCGMRHFRNHRELAAGVSRVAAQHQTMPHVRRDDLQRAVAVEIEQADVGNRRRAFEVERRHDALHELRPLGVRFRPGSGKRKPYRRTRHVERQRALHILRKDDLARQCSACGERFRLPFAEQRHPRDGIGPGTAGQDVRRRIGMTGRSAGRAYFAFVGHRRRLKRGHLHSPQGQRGGNRSHGEHPNARHHPRLTMPLPSTTVWYWSIGTFVSRSTLPLG